MSGSVNQGAADVGRLDVDGGIGHQGENTAAAHVINNLVQAGHIDNLNLHPPAGGITIPDSFRIVSRHLNGFTEVVGRADNLWSRLVKPEDVNEVLERMKRPYEEEHEQSMKEYDLAALRIMSANTVEEARDIVESLM